MRRALLLPLLGTLLLLGGSTVFARPADADDLASAKARANKAAAELGKAESALGALEGQINDLEARKADAEERLDAYRAAAREVAIRRFVNSDTARVAEVADPDINAQARAQTLAKYATQGSEDAIDAYTAAQEDLAVTSERLASRRASQKKAVAELDRRRDAALKELKKLQDIEAAKAKAAGRTAKAGLGRTAPRTPIVVGGSFICPVQGPVSFIDSFGSPRSGGRAHKGVDMLSPRGTPTVAPVSGTVSHRGNSLGGLSWHLNGDDGNYYYGTHLSAYANEGIGHVQAGTVIGYVGDTGNAKGTPHLHFEIHPGHGAAVDPYSTVRKYC